MAHRTIKRAFTLVELMVVLVALGVLVAMVVGIGRRIAQDQNNKQTSANQKIIIGAVEIYHQIERTYPGQLHYCVPVSGGGYCHDPAWQTAENYGTKGKSNEHWRMMTLTLFMSEVSECLDAYTRSDAFQNTGVADFAYVDSAALGTFTDAYGHCMDWDVDGGFGNSPVIVSVGADGFFGHSTPGASPSNIEASEGLYDRIFSTAQDAYTSFQLEAQEDNVRSDGKTKG
jgi:prepilin-type N-terminal cleavage/methylation domain-containing protein